MTHSISPPTTSVIDDTATFIFMTWRHLLCPGDIRRVKANVRRWKERISAAMGSDERLEIFAFIDGTEREICKPGGGFLNALAVWDGHHNMPALGYLGLISPEGLFFLFWGPFAGWVNDHSMTMASSLPEMLEGGLFGEGSLVYGDGGFHLMPGLIVGDPDGDPDARAFMHLTNRHRVSVEWGFGKVLNTFRMHSYTPVQKPNLSRVGVWYLVSVLLMNCQVCLYGSVAAQHFKCPPPTLEEYLRATWDEDPTFAETFERYRPRMYPMRMKGESKNRWNTGKWEWEEMQRLGLEEMSDGEEEEAEDEAC